MNDGRDVLLTGGERVWFESAGGGERREGTIVGGGAARRRSARRRVALGGGTEVVVELLQARADPDLARENNVTPVFMAVQNQHSSTLASLLEGAAKPDVPEPSLAEG